MVYVVTPALTQSSTASSRRIKLSGHSLQRSRPNEQKILDTTPTMHPSADRSHHDAENYLLSSEAPHQGDIISKCPGD
jgi:hypothetical protein